MSQTKWFLVTQQLASWESGDFSMGGVLAIIPWLMRMESLSIGLFSPPPPFYTDSDNGHEIM